MSTCTHPHPQINFHSYIMYNMYYVVICFIVSLHGAWHLSPGSFSFPSLVSFPPLPVGVVPQNSQRSNHSILSLALPLSLSLMDHPPFLFVPLPPLLLPLILLSSPSLPPSLSLSLSHLSSFRSSPLPLLPPPSLPPSLSPSHSLYPSINHYSTKLH